MTPLDRLTRAVGLILALPVIVLALPFVIVGLLLCSIAGLILWAAGFESPKSKEPKE